jgi:hypothetical protein
MTPDRFELKVAAALLDRDPGPARRSLVESVAAIPSEVPLGLRSSLDRRFWPVMRWALVGAAGAAVLLLAGLRWGGSSGPGTASQPDSGAYDPTVIGPGLASTATGWVPVVIVAIAIAAGIAIVWRSRRTAVQALAVVLVLAGIGASLVLTSYNTVAWTDGSVAAGLGYVQGPPATEEPIFDEGPPTRMFAPGPNGFLSFGFDVHNIGPLPITIVGIAPTDDGMAWGRVPSAALLREPSLIPGGLNPADLRPFVPVNVAPGESTFIVVAGQTTACALGPTDDIANANGGAVVGYVDVVYEMLGVRRVTRIQTPIIVNIPMDSACMDRRSSVSPSP